MNTKNKNLVLLIITVLVAVAMVGCTGTVSKEGDATTTTDPVVEYTEELVPENSDGFVSDYDHIEAVRHFKYRNHSYIQFDIAGGQYAKAGIIHDPDCKCSKKSTSIDYAFGMP